VHTRGSPGFSASLGPEISPDPNFHFDSAVA